MGKTGSNTFSSALSFSFRLLTTALENFEYPWDVQTRLFVLLCLLNVFLVLHLFKIEQLFKNTTQRSSLRQDSHGWRGMWENMGRYLEKISPAMVWNFTLEQLQGPNEVI